MTFWQAWILAKIALAAMLLVLLAHSAPARDRGQYSNVDPSIREWVKRLHSPTGTWCCEAADGYPAEAEWDMQTGHYRVRLPDPRYPDQPAEWFVVPDDAVIEDPNRLGYAVVWWYSQFDGSKFTPQIRCFLPGGGV